MYTDIYVICLYYMITILVGFYYTKKSFLGTCASALPSEEQTKTKHDDPTLRIWPSKPAIVLYLFFSPFCNLPRCGDDFCAESRHQFHHQRIYRVRVEDSGSECLAYTGLVIRHPVQLFLMHQTSSNSFKTHISKRPATSAIHPAPDGPCVTWERVSHPRSCG